MSSRIKPFGHPIPKPDLALFMDPDGEHKPVQHEGHTYFVTAWWTLRTTQVTAAPTAPAAPVSPGLARDIDVIERNELPASHWKPLDDITPILNKYPARIWERTQFRHHLQTYPLVQLAHHTAQKGILQLCSRLPRAEVFTGTHLTHLTIRFRTGEIYLHRLPFHWHQEKISLRFYQPKHDPLA